MSPSHGDVHGDALWRDHLDAVEEWLRRTRDLLEGRTDAAAPAPAAAPPGPLPAALRTRAAAALAGMQRLEQLGPARRRTLARGEAYARS
jgi:hypothetical protein